MQLTELITDSGSLKPRMKNGFSQAAFRRLWDRSFTKHTQYALDVGFVNMGWPPFALKWGGGAYLDVAQW